MKLDELRDNAGARARRKRIGRGPGSGMGKTGGRGIKGQTSRSGVAIKGFEGGQMPLHRRLPKRGFNNIFRKRYAVINLSTLQAAIEAGKLKAGETVTEALLLERGVVGRVHDGVRLLGRGELKKKLTVQITGASKSAVDAVEKAGGAITLSGPVEAEKVEARKTKRAKKPAEQAAAGES